MPRVLDAPLTGPPPGCSARPWDTSVDRSVGRRCLAPPRATVRAAPQGGRQAAAREAQGGRSPGILRKSAGRPGVSGVVQEREVVVVGAGQAGLATAWALARQGFDRRTGFVVLDADAAPGGAWQHRWRSLTVATTHRVHELPGLPFTPSRDDAPAADEVPAYFAEYEGRFDLPVRRPVSVSAVHRTADGFRLITSDGGWAARAVVSATGTWTRPFVPHYPGQETFAGQQLHTAGYRGPQEFAGRHVVVVGGGASAVQLLGEISAVTSTTWVTRRPPVWREGPFGPEDGRAAVAMVERAVREGRVPGSVVGVTGLVVTPWVRDARERGVLHRLPVLDRLTPDGG